MITLYRFSENGFIPQTQHYHIKQITTCQDILRGEFADRMSMLSAHAQQLMIAGAQSTLDELSDDWEQETVGFWAFVDELNPSETQFQLNHLSAEQKEKGEWHCITLPDETLVYPTALLWKQEAKVALSQCHKGMAVFVPTPNL